MTAEAKTPTAKKTISLPSEMADAAAEKARAEHRTLSSYIQSLIARDLEHAREVAHAH